MAELRPAVYRLMVDWRLVQPDPARPPDLDAARAGCMRDRGPCRPWAGVREQLRALAARQREAGPGTWQGLVVITGTPDWAARPPGGCERPGTEPRSRAPRSDAVPAYRRLIAALVAAARETGASVPYWSAYNEPNHPYFASPQRGTCDAGAPSLAVGPYVELAQAMRAELAAQPGEQEMVLGELAAALERRRTNTTVEEFVAALPRELVCSSPVWSQHAYVGGRDPVDVVSKALAAHACPRPHAIWITETGAGAPSRELSLAGAFPDERTACEQLDARLRTWHADPRVTLAAQYTVREDDTFRTGLVTTSLRRAYAVLGLWRAWGGVSRPDPEAPPPARACAPGT